MKKHLLSVSNRPDNEFMVSILESCKRFERAELSKRIKRGLMVKKQRLS